MTKKLVEFVSLSEIAITSTDLEGAPWSWGDAAHTLVHSSELAEWLAECEIDDSIVQRVHKLDCFVDLES